MARGERDVIETSPRSDAYTGLMAISLLAMIVGCALLYLDYDQYGQKKPEAPPPPVQVKPGGGQQQAQPGAARGAPAGNVPK